MELVSYSMQIKTSTLATLFRGGGKGKLSISTVRELCLRGGGKMTRKPKEN